MLEIVVKKDYASWHKTPRKGGKQNISKLEINSEVNQVISKYLYNLCLDVSVCGSYCEFNFEKYRIIHNWQIEHEKEKQNMLLRTIFDDKYGGKYIGHTISSGPDRVQYQETPVSSEEKWHFKGDLFLLKNES